MILKKHKKPLMALTIHFMVLRTAHVILATILVKICSQMSRRSSLSLIICGLSPQPILKVPYSKDQMMERTGHKFSRQMFLKCIRAGILGLLIVLISIAMLDSLIQCANQLKQKFRVSNTAHKSLYPEEIRTVMSILFNRVLILQTRQYIGLLLPQPLLIFLNHSDLLSEAIQLQLQEQTLVLHSQS